MGNGLHSCFNSSGSNLCCAKSVYQIRVAGPAQAGKTSIIKWMKYRQFLTLEPTEGLEIDRIDYPDTALVLWDTRQRFEDMVRPHHLDIRGIIYVVDSSDPGRLRVAHRSLERVLRDLPDASVLLVFATQQDRPGALPVTEIQHQLQLQHLVDKEWRLASAGGAHRHTGVFACSAKTGEGIDDGIHWMTRQLRLQDGTNCCSIEQNLPCFLQSVP